MTRLDRYIFRQLALALLAVTVGLAVLVWLTQSLRFIELVLDRGLSFLVFIELTGLLLPGFFAIILPITTFLVALFVYVRLSTDRELVVMRAAGLSQWRLARPAIALALFSMAACYALNLLAGARDPGRLPRLAVRDPQPARRHPGAGGRVLLGRRRPHRLRPAAATATARCAAS